MYGSRLPANLVARRREEDRVATASAAVAARVRVGA
jgi:colicin import membrane protein